ncbi:hypothetical protein [Desulfogranum marinum]|uniref:hypothetical protein n=1 Tax=Desulfogranum marinum TaxID=453220 RepID=UPI00196559B6|nr:hypothetical protein [Desulfogranum marinum]MBM9511904.1 hypothetical protein [Desulfogranum marinum]
MAYNLLPLRGYSLLQALHFPAASELHGMLFKVMASYVNFFAETISTVKITFCESIENQ